MNLNTIAYWIKEGFSSIKKNAKTVFISLGTIIAAMIIIGFFFILIENANHWMAGIEEDQGIQAYLLDTVAEEKVTELEGLIKNIDGVANVEYISKEAAFEKEKAQVDEQYQALFEGREDIYPASFVVTLNDLDAVGKVTSKIKDLDGIDTVRYSDETIRTLKKIALTVKVISSMFLIILIVVAVLLMMNSVKLIMYARRNEIQIMKYVGATDRFIKGPFIIEGVIVGVLGALISLVIIDMFYSTLTSDASNMVVGIGEIRGTLFWIFVLLGIGIGTVGSSISIKKYLDV